MGKSRVLKLKEYELNGFKRWLSSNGYTVVETSNNPYEILRALKQGEQPLLIYKKNSGDLSASEETSMIVGRYLQNSLSSERTSVVSSSDIGKLGGFNKFQESQKLNKPDFKKIENPKQEKPKSKEFVLMSNYWLLMKKYLNDSVTSIADLDVDVVNFINAEPLELREFATNLSNALKEEVYSRVDNVADIELPFFEE